MFQPVIKWSGSKRSQANTIISYLPQKFNCYYEPFLGGGSMLYAVNPSEAICGDVCESLIDLWNKIKNEPSLLAESYRSRWTRLQEEGYSAYYSIRDDYNHSKKGDYPKFCVKSMQDLQDDI